MMANFRCGAAFLVIGVASAAQQPFWGCGLLGDLPGISKDGTTSAAMKTLIDGLKPTNKYDGKVSYWNWNYAPSDVPHCTGNTTHQYLTKDFVFMPENWGVGVVNASYLRTAHTTDWLDSNGIVSPATMSDIFLGSNEPDIYGSCMGDMMGKCTKPCSKTADTCPVAEACGQQGSAEPNAQGECNCYSKAHATGVGFWGLNGVSGQQPLPTCWENKGCIDSIMGSWKKTSTIAAEKGYRFTSAPLVAVNLNWTENFVAAACNGCSDISCGCPTHIGWHFYANDCQPEHGGYASFQKKLDKTIEIMEKYPHLQGAIVNEVGMLNCAMDTPDAICVPNGPDQKYPAKDQPHKACPSTPALPKGMASFIEKLLEMLSQAKTKDGRRAVVSFTWFNENMSGGTYDLRLFDEKGGLNEAGESYISACQKWADDKPGSVDPVVV